MSVTAFVALLRAVNVGGTGKLSMQDLVSLCRAAGFENPHTYIASGNVVFQSPASATDVKAILESALQGFVGKSVPAMIRTAAELESILRTNPFPDADPSHTMVVFLDAPPDPQALAAATGWNGEDARLGTREIFIHYGAGMGHSKLRIPAAGAGTARNVNTVAKLASLARARTS